MVTRHYIPERGDLVWVNLNPTRGHEQKDLRPALVLSPKAYNIKTSLILVIPITSHIKNYPFEVAVSGKKVAGVALADQVRALDWHARSVRFIEKIPVSTVYDIQMRLVALITE